MKAVTFSKYGSPDVLELQEIEKPTPQDNEVLVKIHASSVNPAEWHDMTGTPFIARVFNKFPKMNHRRIGVDYAGVIEAVAKDRTDFKVGDEVFGAKNGAFGEYVCVQNIIIPKPKNISFEEAASVPIAAITALQGLQKHGNIQAGQKVLINGASGGVGHFAVQIAKAFGAEVTGVCSSRNVELVRSLGADHVIDYTKENFTHNGKKYDLLLDIAGGYTWSEYKKILSPNAKVIIIGGPKKNRLVGPLGNVLKMKIASWFASQNVTFFIAQFNKDDMFFIKELLESGKVKPYVEKTYPLNKIADAMNHLGTGHAQGKIVVTM